jgi:hypothetical protein
MGFDRSDDVIELLKCKLVARARELDGLGPGAWRTNALFRGVRRIARGVYVLDRGVERMLHPIAKAAVAAPQAVVCLASALEVHGFRHRRSPGEWLAIENHARAPVFASNMKVQLVRFSGRAWEEQIETFSFGPIVCRVYSLAKTVVDCFRLRSRLPEELPLKALRFAVQVHRIAPHHLLELADRYRTRRPVEAAIRRVGSEHRHRRPRAPLRGYPFSDPSKRLPAPHKQRPTRGIHRDEWPDFWRRGKPPD